MVKTYRDLCTLITALYTKMTRKIPGRKIRIGDRVTIAQRLIHEIDDTGRVTVMVIEDPTVYVVYDRYTNRDYPRSSEFRYRVGIRNQHDSDLVAFKCESQLVLVPPPKKPKHKITVNTRRSW